MFERHRWEDTRRFVTSNEKLMIEHGHMHIQRKRGGGGARRERKGCKGESNNKITCVEEKGGLFGTSYYMADFIDGESCSTRKCACLPFFRSLTHTQSIHSKYLHIGEMMIIYLSPLENKKLVRAKTLVIVIRRRSSRSYLGKKFQS